MSTTPPPRPTRVLGGSVTPAHPVGKIDDPTRNSIRPALEWESLPDTSHPGHVGEWRDIRYEVGFPANTNGGIAKILSLIHI